MCGGAERRVTVCGAKTMCMAERILTAHPMHLIVSDLSLPDSRGPSTVRRLRAVAPRTPLLILTGREDEEILRRCEELGADACRFKGDVGGDELIGLVRTMAASSPSGDRRFAEPVPGILRPGYTPIR
ncbi:MAG: response regulator [Planctomycetia bacterium]|nr:response regulator [Planctomycetia bacterium]